MTEIRDQGMAQRDHFLGKDTVYMGQCEGGITISFGKCIVELIHRLYYECMKIKIREDASVRGHMT